MSSKYEYDDGEIAQIRTGARVTAGRLAFSDLGLLTHFASATQNCVILGKNNLLPTSGQYFVFLQQDQVQGWVYYYDLEKLDG